VDQQPCVFLAPLYQAERLIADQIKRLCTTKPAWPAADANKAITWAERKLGIDLAPCQNDAIALALKSAPYLPFGGTG
jgi:exodeoxyribonuclease V alpha subunit